MQKERNSLDHKQLSQAMQDILINTLELFFFFKKKEKQRHYQQLVAAVPLSSTLAWYLDRLKLGHLTGDRRNWLLGYLRDE